MSAQESDVPEPTQPPTWYQYLDERFKPLATRELVREELAAVKTELRGEITFVRDDVNGVRGDVTGVQGEIGGLKGEIGELKGMLRVMMRGGGIVGAVVLAAAVRTLFGW